MHKNTKTDDQRACETHLSEIPPQRLYLDQKKIQQVKSFVLFRHVLYLVIFVSLLGNQEVFGQSTLIKGKLVDYETGEKKPISRIEYIYNGGRTVAKIDSNANFVLELKSNTGYLYIMQMVNCYGIKIYNIPRDSALLDFGEIKLVKNPRSLIWNGISPEEYTKEQKKLMKEDSIIRNEVLEKYRLDVNGKKLKPSFEGSNSNLQKIVFDFNKE